MAMPFPVHITEPPPIQMTPSMSSRRTRLPWSSMCEQRASIPHSSNLDNAIFASASEAKAAPWNACFEMTGSDTTSTRDMLRSRASAPIMANDPAPATTRVGMKKVVIIASP